VTKVFITGISGFIGSNLAINLVKEGYSIDGLIRQISSRELASLEPVLDKIHLIKGDITSYHSVNSAIGSSLPQCVLHLGALTPVRLSFEDPKYLVLNSTKKRKLLEWKPTLTSKEGLKSVVWKERNLKDV